MDCFECVGRGWVRVAGYGRPLTVTTGAGKVTYDSAYFAWSDLCERCDGSGEES